MSPITDTIIAEHGISPDEYDYILKILGTRAKSSRAWHLQRDVDEHASYKNSILQLKTLPKEGSMMHAKAGEENAGVVDIGDDLAISFKIESHNHPSALSLIMVQQQALAYPKRYLHHGASLLPHSTHCGLETPIILK
jgi:phosphoribosylformylglycinamidine (FGAM) synthase-like enzyme